MMEKRLRIPGFKNVNNPGLKGYFPHGRWGVQLRISGGVDIQSEETDN